jgi:hypothetical protein
MFGLLMLLAAADAPHYFSGADLYAKCTSAQEIDQRYCDAYITGAADGTLFGANMTLNNPMMSCPPADRSHFIEIVKERLKNDVKHRDLPAELLVWGALHTAYPCPK